MSDLLTPDELEGFANLVGVGMHTLFSVDEILRKAAATMRQQSNDLADLQRRATATEVRVGRLEVKVAKLEENVLDALEKLLP